MKQTDQYVVVPVTPQTPEYKTVEQQFAATAQNAFSTIVKVTINLRKLLCIWNYCFGPLAFVWLGSPTAPMGFFLSLP